LFGGNLISLESLEKAHTPYMKKFGYGWRIRESNNKNILFHYGYTPRFKIYMAINRSENTFIILLSNIFNSNIETIQHDLNSLVF